MGILNFLQSKLAPTAVSRGEAAAPSEPLTANQRAILAAIRRHEARVAPRLGDREGRRRPRAPAAERKRAADVRDIFSKQARKARRVRVPFSLTLPKALIDEIAEDGYERIRLEPVNGGLRFTLSKGDSEAEGAATRTHDVAVVREKAGERDRSTRAGAAIRYDEADHKLEWVRRAKPIPPRLLASRGLHQGDAQRRLLRATGSSNGRPSRATDRAREKAVQKLLRELKKDRS